MQIKLSAPTGRPAGITLRDFILAASCSNTFIIALYVMKLVAMHLPGALKRLGKAPPPPGAFILGLANPPAGGWVGVLFWIRTLQTLGHQAWPALAGGGKGISLAEILGGGPPPSGKPRQPASFRPLAALTLIYMILGRLGAVPVPTATAKKLNRLPPLFPVTPASVAAWWSVADALLVQDYGCLSAIPLPCVQEVLNYSTYAPKGPMNQQTAAQYHKNHNSVIRAKLKGAFGDICGRFADEPMLQPALAL